MAVNTLVSPETGIPYTLEKRIGGGAYGIVHRVHDDADNLYAAKLFILPTDPRGRLRAMKIFNNEYNAQRIASMSPQCQSNIVCLYDAFLLDSENLGVLIYELMDGDTENNPPDSNNFLIAMRSTLEGLRYLHEHGLAHRDIKPANILRKGMSIFKIGDLGFLCDGGGNRADDLERCNYRSWTLVYSPPEAFKTLQADPRGQTDLETHQKGDIWALGITLYEFLFNEFPFDESVSSTQFARDMQNATQDDIDMILKSTFAAYAPSSPLPLNNIHAMLRSMLLIDPSSRASAAEALEAFDIYFPLAGRPANVIGVDWNPEDIYDLEEGRVLTSQDIIRNSEASLLDENNLDEYRNAISEYLADGRFDITHLQEMLDVLERDLAIRKHQGLNDLVPYTEALIKELEDILRELQS